MTPFSTRTYNSILNNSNHNQKNHPRLLSMSCSTTGPMSTFTKSISLKTLKIKRKSPSLRQWWEDNLRWTTRILLPSHDQTTIFAKTTTSLTSRLKMMSQKTKRKASRCITRKISKNRRNKLWLVLSRSRKMTKLSQNLNISSKEQDRAHYSSVHLAKTINQFNQSQERQSKMRMIETIGKESVRNFEF